MWSVELIGKSSDLVDFTLWFPDEPAKVVANGDRFFLEGELFEKILDHGDVRIIAEERLKLMRAAIKLGCGGLSSYPAVGTIYRLDNLGLRHAFSPGVNLTVKIGIEVRSFNDSNQRPTALQKRVESSTKNESLHAAMILWADDNRSWPRLYRILEEIEHALGGRKVHEAGLTSKALRECFTQTANHHETAGADSRHGPKGWKPPKKPMSIRDAQAFIATLLDQALLIDEDSRSIS